MLQEADAVNAKIDFVWKFDRDDEEHERELRYKTDLMVNYVRDHDHGENITKLDLYPVERLGFSGSRVFYLDVSFREGEGLPERLVAKFHSATRTYNEFKSASLATRYRICGEVYSSHKNKPSTEAESKPGLIVYKFAKLSHKRAMEFRDFYLSKKNSNNTCVEVISSLYNNTIHLDPEDLMSGTTAKLVGDYKWYYSRSTAPLDKLEQLSCALVEGDDLSFKSSKILSFFETLTTSNEYCDIEVRTMFQHGDLHARNILLDPKNTSIQPDLIDFDWTSFAHAGRDFTVLETTLKYMLIKEYSLRNVKGVKKHVSPVDYINLENALCECKFDFPADPKELFVKYRIDENETVMRAYECIKIIRENAQRFLECSFSEERPITIEKEYFIALFMVSLGHIAYETSDDYWVLSGCDLLIDKIKGMD